MLKHTWPSNNHLASNLTKTQSSSYSHGEHYLSLTHPGMASCYIKRAKPMYNITISQISQDSFNIFLKPIFALNSWVQAARFEYNEPYKQNISFLSSKGVWGNFRAFVELRIWSLGGDSLCCQNHNSTTSQPNQNKQPTNQRKMGFTWKWLCTPPHPTNLYVT